MTENTPSPHRRLRRSLVAMRGFGIAGLTLGSFNAVFLITYPNLFVALLVPLTPMAIGFAHLMLATQLNRRRRWAVTASLVLVSVEVILAAFATFALVMSAGMIDLARGKRLGAAVYLFVFVVVLLLLGRLIADLSVLYRSLDDATAHASGRRGFEAIPFARRMDDSKAQADDAP